MGSGHELFKGKSIITYDPVHFSREEALQHYLHIKRTHSLDINREDLLRIDINKKHKHNSYYLKSNQEISAGRTFNFLLNGSENKPENRISSESKPINLSREIKRVKLSTPYLRSDKRWNSIGLTSSPLFLGSALIENSFNVNIENISLPVSKSTNFSKNIDLWGFTLFEDVFTEFKEFMESKPADPEIITAAGGPFITLNPLSGMFHLPEINLFIRGEGEYIFPKILKSIKNGDLKNLFKLSGFFYQNQGLILLSGYNEINTIDNLGKLSFHFSFSGKKELSNGLEMNFSRGCRNNCIFCSKVQGRKFRELPIKNIKQLLFSFTERLKELHLDKEISGVININDDDILQNIRYADSVFKEIISNNLSLWGIQSSITSFFKKNGEINTDAIELISNTSLFRNSHPLLWTGTDTFLKSRSIRLGKPLPGLDLIYKLLEKFENHGINNYHYWISSDHLSTWKEFFEEFQILYDLKSNFPHFSLLANSPFIIPYPSTPAFKLITRSENFVSQIKYKKIIKGCEPLFDLTLVDYVETRHEYLNRLLKNETLPGKIGFFDYLKKGEMKNAAISAYSFLKQERISGEELRDERSQDELLDIERKAADFITKII